MTTPQNRYDPLDVFADGRTASISEARARFAALIERSSDHDIVIMNHGRPAAVLMSPEHYRSLLDELDDLQDRLAVWENADAPAMSFDHFKAELAIEG